MGCGTGTIIDSFHLNGLKPRTLDTKIMGYDMLRSRWEYLFPKGVVSVITRSSQNDMRDMR